MSTRFVNLPDNGAANYREPVANFANLPPSGNVDGDVRVALDTGTIYVWNELSSTWVTASGGVGLTSLNGQTGSSQSFSVGTSGSDVNISSALDVHTINVPDASATARGVVTTGIQTFSGNKTFQNDVTFNGTVTGISQYKVQKITLTAPQVAAKAVILAEIPSVLNLTRLIPINGVEQDYSVDFTVSGTILSWSTLGLDGVLDVGDKLIIIYN